MIFGKKTLRLAGYLSAAALMLGACDIDWDLSTCTVDSHCLLDEVCSSGFCLPKVDACSLDSDCAQGATCDTQGICVADLDPLAGPTAVD